MFTDFSNLSQKNIAPQIRPLSASDSSDCCTQRRECKGRGARQTDNNVPSSGGADSVYVCDRDYEERICDGATFWVGSVYNCKSKPREGEEEEEEKKDDQGGGGTGGGGSGGGGSGGGSGGGDPNPDPNPDPEPDPEPDPNPDPEPDPEPDPQPPFDPCSLKNLPEFYTPWSPSDPCYGKIGDPVDPNIWGANSGNMGGADLSQPEYTDEYIATMSDVRKCIASGNSTTECLKISGETSMASDFNLQSNPAYKGQSGSSPATYPAVGTTSPNTSSGASAWVTDYNSVGFMNNDTIRGGTYSAPSGGNFSTTQGTNPATQVGIANPLQQSIYDTFTNVTGAGNQVYMGGSPYFNEATGQYTNVTRNPIANPNTLPTMLSEYDLFGNVGASSGLFLDTPTIKQNGVATTPEVDATTEPEPVKEGGGLGLAAIGFIALKLLSVI